MTKTTGTKHRHRLRLDDTLEARLIALAKKRSITGLDVEIRRIKTDIMIAGVAAIVEKLEAENNEPLPRNISPAPAPPRPSSRPRAQTPSQPGSDRRSWPVEELDPDDDEPSC